MNAASTFTVQNNSTLNCQTNIVSGGTFTHNLGGTLGIGSTAGITVAGTASGNIQTTTRNYGNSGTSSRYSYTGSSAQVTGDGLPSSVHTLIINTSGGANVTLSTPNPLPTPNRVSISNTVQLTSGVLVIDATTLSMANAATFTGSPFTASNMIATIGASRYAGRVERIYPSGTVTGTPFTIPFGDITGTAEYSPLTITLAYTGASSNPYVGFKCKDAKHPLDPSLTNFITRYWESVSGTWTGASAVTLNATFTYVAADIVGAIPALKVNRFSMAGVTAGTWFEDASSSNANPVLTSASMPLTDFQDHDFTGRQTVPLYFRSATSGIWESAANWLVSTDINFASPAGVTPSTVPLGGNSDQIRIMNSHNITYNSLISAPLIIDQTQVDNGGGLILNTNSYLVVNNGTGVDLQVDGTLTLSGGNTIFGMSASYSSTSSLVYTTGTSAISGEWTGSGTTPGYGIPNDVTLTSGATLNMTTTARGLARDLAITSGTLNLNATSGDLYVGRNWTRANTANFNPNNRAVFFNGAANQTVTVTGTGTETFAYLLITKSAGNFVLNNSPATSVTVNASSGDVLTLNSGNTIDLNGQTLTLSGSGGNFNLPTPAATATITGAANSVFAITNGTKTITPGASVLLSFDSNVRVSLSSGLNFGSNTSTINGTLRINSGGSVNTNAPFYASGSQLQYFTNALFNRGVEWRTASGAGYPHHVQLSNNTILNPGGNSNTGQPLNLAGDLTIDSGSSLFMDYATDDMTVPLSISGGLSLSGNLSLSNAVGGDVQLSLDWINNGSGNNFNSNGRSTTFAGSANQNIGGSNSSSNPFSFLMINNNAGVTLTAYSIVVNNQLSLSATSSKVTLGIYDLTLGSSATLIGASSSKYIVTDNTGNLRMYVSNSDLVFPVGTVGSYAPATLNQAGTAETMGVRVKSAPTFDQTVSDANQLINLQWYLNESNAGANNLVTKFNWNGSDEAGSFVRANGVFHGNWNGSTFSVRPCSATTGSNPYLSTSTVNYTGTLSSQLFLVGNINGLVGCIQTLAGGSWNVGSNWDFGGSVPPNDAYVCVNHAMTVATGDTDPNIVTGITFNSGGSLTVGTGRVITVGNLGSIINGSGSNLNFGSGEVVCNGTVSIAGANSITFNNLTINGNTTLTTSPIITGALQLNAGSFFVPGSPTYTSGASLIYNTGGSYTMSSEWTGNSVTAGLGVPTHVVIQSGTTVNFPTSNRGLAGDLSINSGTLVLNASSGDLYVAGNWTRNSSATFTHNNRAVFLNGSGTQTISVTGGGTASYAFLLTSSKPSGSIVLSSSPATNLAITGNSGTILSLTSNAPLNLNGQTLSLSGTGGNINVTTGASSITGSSGSLVSVSNGTKTVTSSGGGSLVFDDNVRIALLSGINFGAGLSTINGILQIPFGGFVTTNAPFYGPASILRYFSGSTYVRGVEWSATSGAGYPNHVTIDPNGTNTLVDMGSGATNRSIAGDLTINTNGGLTMSSMSGNLIVGGNVNVANSGTLTLSSTFDGDLIVAKDFTITAGGTFTQSSRELEMNGNITQNITGISNFTFLAINNSGSSVKINANTTVSNRIRLTNGTLDFNGSSITMSNGSQIYRTASSATMNAEPSLAPGDVYDVRYAGTFTTGNEFSSNTAFVRDLILESGGTTTLGANRTVNRHVLMAGDLNLGTSALTHRGRNAVLASAGNLEITSGNRTISGSTGSSYDFTGLGGNNPVEYSKSITNPGGGTLTFGSNVLVRIADGRMDFGTGNPTTINGVLQVMLGGSVSPNACYYGVGSTLRFANTVDYQVPSSDVTWSSGAIASGLPGIPWNVEVLDGGTDLQLQDTRALRGNLTITNGTFTLTPAYTGSFNIGGDWTRTGSTSSFVHNSKKVIFDRQSAGNQTITVGSTVTEEVFYDLEVSLLSGNLQLGTSSNATVRNAFSFVSGKMNLNGANTLAIGTSTANGTISGFDNTKYVIGGTGNIKRFTNSNATYVYPLGDGSNYNPFELTLTNGGQAGAFVTGKITSGAHPNLGSATKYVNKYWTIEPSGLAASPVYNVLYTYSTGDIMGAAGTLYPTKYSSLGWISSPGSLAVAIDGTSANHDVTGKTFTWSGLTTFSEFTAVGDGDPLPVELLNFNATAIDNKHVYVNWTTASEINSAYFTVERSTDAVHYAAVGKVAASGNTTLTNVYDLTDYSPYQGVSYYRLRQTDFNGDFELFDPVAVNINQGFNTVMNVYPNPTTDRVTVQITTSANEQGTLLIMDMQGKTVTVEPIHLKTGINQLPLNLSKLADGNYMVSLIHQDGSRIQLPVILRK
jgi:hypothetical protein